MGSLRDSLKSFQNQQQKCQETLKSIASQVPPKSAIHQRSVPVNAPTIAKAPAPTVKFSNDTERLQHINSIRKAPVGAQIKRVINLLLKTRHAFTAEQINDSCYVDVKANKAVFDSLTNNPKVYYDGKRFSYKSKHDVKDKKELLVLIRKFPEGIDVVDLKDAYPSVMKTCRVYMQPYLAKGFFSQLSTSLLLYLGNLLWVEIRNYGSIMKLKAAGDIWLLSNFDSQEDIAYPNDPKVPIKVDDDLKQLFRGLDLPSDMLDIEKDLQKNGMKPATNTAKRRAMAQVHGIVPKPTKKKGTKKQEITKRTKLTNAHLPELFKHLTGPSK